MSDEEDFTNARTTQRVDAIPRAPLPVPAVPLEDRLTALAEELFPDRLFEGWAEGGVVQLHLVFTVVQHVEARGELAMSGAKRIDPSVEVDDELLFEVLAVEGDEVHIKLVDPLLREIVELSQTQLDELVTAARAIV